MGFWASLIVVALVAVAAFVVTRRYLAYRGARLVQCPENKQAAAVNVSAGRIALGGGWHLSDCSRWPEHQACGRECLEEIEQSHDGCLVRNIVTRWYEEKSCAICRKPLDHVDWHDRKPAVMDDSGVATQWRDVRPETLPQVLATHRPVCFDCYVSETFRRQHPELVLDNPWTPGTPRA